MLANLMALITDRLGWSEGEARPVEARAVRPVRQAVHALLWQSLPQQYCDMPRPPSFCVDPYVVDTLMQDLVGHDRRPSAFIVYLFFLRRCAGQADGVHRASLAEIADGTGLSRRAVQDAIAHLRRRKLLVA